MHYHHAQVSIVRTYTRTCTFHMVNNIFLLYKGKLRHVSPWFDRCNNPITVQSEYFHASSGCIPLIIWWVSIGLTTFHQNTTEVPYQQLLFPIYFRHWFTHTRRYIDIQQTVNNIIVEELGYVHYYAKNPFYSHSYITYWCVGLKGSLYKSCIQLP